MPKREFNNRGIIAARLDACPNTIGCLKRASYFTIPSLLNTPPTLRSDRARNDVLRGRVCGHSGGYGFFIPDDNSGDLFLHHRQMRRLLHGDFILAKRGEVDARGRREATVVEVLTDEPREIVGQFHIESQVGFVVPNDARHARHITIAAAQHNAADGDIVVARITEHPATHRDAAGVIVEVLGKNTAAGMETDIAIRAHDIPNKFPAQVKQELAAMREQLHSAPPQKSRRDLRDLPLVTIDGADARDFDDAVFCEQSRNGRRLVVAIADVGHYVRAGSALDAEALQRGNSVYFPSRVVPMLPEELSNGICSLNPNEDRYCMVCDMQINHDGEVTDYEFYPGLMHSKARLTYEIVSEIVTAKNDAADVRKKYAAVVPPLEELSALTGSLLERRRQRGTIDFEFPEPQIIFDAQEKIKSITARARNRAHRMIEECMLAANLCAARELQKHFGDATIYRNHLGPDDESLAELRGALSGMGLQLSGGAQPVAGDYARLVEAVAQKPESAPLVQMLLLRSLSQAEYATEQAGHFALAYPIYTHFTSPIRRYADLIVHRQLRQLCDGKKPDTKQKEMKEIAKQCSFTERRADDASREVISRLKAEFMRDKLGEEFGGVISGVKEFGIFVQLDDVFVDGMVHVSGLGDDYFTFDAARSQLVGERGGKKFFLGERVRVIIAGVNVREGKIDFELCGAKKREKTNKKQHHRGKKNAKRSKPRR